MAVTPLFNSSTTTVKAALRLSGTANSDGLVMIDQAVQQARMVFFDRLSEARITELLAIPYNENPTTASAMLRLKANLCEIAIARAILLRKMPVLFMDGSAVTREVWNEEGLTRESQRNLDSEIARLEQEIDDYFDALDDGTFVESSLNIETLASDTTSQEPGDTVREGRFHQIFPWRNDPC